MTGADRPIPANLSEQLGDVVTRMRRALRRSIRAGASEPLRSVAQVEVLQAVAESERCRVGDLAARLQLAQSTVSALLTNLMSAGLIVRSVDAGDRRAAVVSLTPSGADQLTLWRDAHRHRLDQALVQLDEADRASVFAALDALTHLVDALEQDAGGAAASG